MTKATERKSKLGESSIKDSTDALWEIQAELESYSFLLRWNNHDDAQALYGLGIALDRISHRIGELAETFPKTFQNL